MENTGKCCYNPNDLYKILIQSKVSYEEQHGIEQRLKENCRENGLEFHGLTPGNGDCFFEAIASQLRRIGAQQSSSVQLRQEVTEYIRQHPTYEGPEGPVSLDNFTEGPLEDYCDKMAKRGAWADHVVVINMAKMLEHDIMIVTSSPSTSGNDCLVWVTGDRSGKKEPLLLGHLWENHYQSLQPIKPIVSSLTEKQFEQFEDSPFTRKKDGQFKDSPLTGKQECDGYSEDWLRDKIGSFDIPSVPAYYRPLSLRLFSVMDDIGASEDVRKVRMESSVTSEILNTVNRQPEMSVYSFGSRADGSTTEGVKSDLDTVVIFNNLPVVTDPSEHPVGTSLLLIQDATTPAGYCKLQLVQDGVPQYGDVPDADPFPDQWYRNRLQCASDLNNRVVCFFAKELTKLFDQRHGPAVTSKATTVKLSQDIVFAGECDDNTNIILKWLTRARNFNWPTDDILQVCKTLGCLFVPVGHPHSEDHEQQWRISLSHQEKLLVTQFNSVQLKCFILLKMIKKGIILQSNADSLSSYHIKTCMLFLIENTPSKFWKPENLLVCISLCLRKLLKWVDAGYCPNYFIPEENMFDRRVHGTVRQRLLWVLQQLVSADCKFLSDIQCDGLGDRFIKYFLTPCVTIWDDDGSDHISPLSKLITVCGVCGVTFGTDIEHFASICERHIETTLKHMLKSISTLRNTTTITRHTIEETQKVKALILPYLELKLMSTSVGYAVNQIKPARDIWRILTSIRWKEMCLSSDSFSSRLKQASLLYMMGYYQTSPDVLSTLTGLVRYTYCKCYHDKDILVPPDGATLLETTRGTCISKVTPEYLIRNVIIPCVHFLPTEKSVTPAASCYEMERMRSPRVKSYDDLCILDIKRGDWAFVDGNFLLHFLLYLNHKKLNMTDHVTADIDIMWILLWGNNAKHLCHRETCFNLPGWVYKKQGEMDVAERYFKESLQLKPQCNAAFQHIEEF